MRKAEFPVSLASLNLIHHTNMPLNHSRFRGIACYLTISLFVSISFPDELSLCFRNLRADEPFHIHVKIILLPQRSNGSHHR